MLRIMASEQRKLIICVLFLSVLASEALDYGLENNVKELVSRRKNLDYMKKLVADLDDQLTRLHKRSCAMRLHGIPCSGFEDVSVGSHEKESIDESLLDKIRRSTCDVRLGNPEGCLGQLIDGDKKDNENWGDPDSPGRK